MERIAAIRPDSPLPAGTIATRTLGYYESAKVDSASLAAGVARVIVQIMVEKDGRADPTHVTILATSDWAAARIVKSAVARLRFEPALYSGQPVHQSAIWVFDLRRPLR